MLTHDRSLQRGLRAVLEQSAFKRERCFTPAHCFQANPTDWLERLAILADPDKAQNALGDKCRRFARQLKLR
ncbi:hypothetical protein [Labrys neptuniae]